MFSPVGPHLRAQFDAAYVDNYETSAEYLRSSQMIPKSSEWGYMVYTLEGVGEYLRRSWCSLARLVKIVLRYCCQVGLIQPFLGDLLSKEPIWLPLCLTIFQHGQLQSKDAASWPKVFPDGFSLIKPLFRFVVCILHRTWCCILGILRIILGIG